MNQTIDEAIYTASPATIGRHRYNPIIGFALTIVSGLSLWANGNVNMLIENEILAQWNLLFGICGLCTGLTMICYWLFGDSSKPLHKSTREKMYRSEFFFELNELPKVSKAVETGDFTILHKLPKSYQPAAQVICYRTDSGSVIATQILRHQEPVCDIKIFKEGEYNY